MVDDGSTDATSEVAARAGIRVVRQPHLGAGAARNRGAQEVTGDILVFLDGDMVMGPRFVEELIAPMLEEDAPGTFTKDIRVANADRLWARAHMLGRGLPTENHFRADFPDRWHNYRAIWRKHFESVGGFDEIGHGEDITLGRKLGMEAHAASGAECWHYEPDSLVEIFRSARWYGRGERIKELDDPRSFHAPRASLHRGMKLARRHRIPALLLYRLVWDCGVSIGLRTRRAGTAK